MNEETIAALSTPPGRGGIAVIRVSGPRAGPLLHELIEGAPDPLQPNLCFHGYLRADGAGGRLDECLALFFRAPHSFTGEDVAEISLHANPFIVEEALDLLARRGARPALAGEFSFRAWRNGKIDLLQAEAIHELVFANSRAYARLAFSGLEGALSQEVARLRQRLLELAIAVETAIEFQEDQALGEIPLGEGIAEMCEAVEAVLRSARFGERLNRGLQVVIAGKVNAGKSSLFNALLLQERAITSAAPGTTRDYLSETLILDGFPFVLNDVAGLATAQEGGGDAVEQEAITRSWQKIEASDAVVFLFDASETPSPDDLRLFQRAVGSRPHLVVANKADIASEAAVALIRASFGSRVPLISATQGRNLETVREFLKSLRADLGGLESSLAVNRRQQQLFERLREKLQGLRKMFATPRLFVELAGEEVRQALGVIGELTGEVGVDDVLQGIFANFCIGK